MQCSRCGAENRAGARFCDACGVAFAKASSEAPGPSAAGATQVRVNLESARAELPEGERKTVTALFADLKGSTELMEDLDPEEARAIVDPALKIMVEAVRRYEGYVVQSTGDGIFALFGAPLAHEDHPQRGLYAALQIQQELREYGLLRKAQGAHALEARVGINTGEVVVRSVETGGKIEYTPIGHTANLASRLQTLAPAGSIAVSEYTRTLCEGYFELRALGPMAVRGISEPINIYEVTGLGALRTHFQLSARRGLTKFVGREHELEQMHRALELAMGGHGRIVAVMAEAGTGKSRLFYEFKATQPPACKVLEAYSVSHGKASAWLPVLELLRRYFGVQDADDATSRREKVEAVLNGLDPALQDTLPYLLTLLGIQENPDPLAQMDPQIKRQRTLDAIKRVVLRESLNQPLVVIFEDLHWIDGQTQALLDLIADSIPASQILLLVNYRPEYSDQWDNKTYYSQIRLNPLGGADGAAMLSFLLGEGIELNPIKRLIVERTDGNPFFIEEIVQGLFDEGALVRNGAVKVTRSLSQLRLPPTVQGILASRIDRQPSEHKQLLQTLAVIGRESSLGLLSQVASHTDTQLERILADLQASEFIYEQPATIGIEYVFKHALTQEVAYNSLLIERRKLRHERTGQALESIFPEQLDDHLTQLAHHYSHSDNLDKAVEYLGRAGRQAMQRSAHADAVTNLSAAIELLQRLPDSPECVQRELRLQLAIGPALISVKGWGAPEVERASTRARELCERLGDPPELFSALGAVWNVRFIRAELRRALEDAQQLLRRAESSHDPALLLSAHRTLGETLFHMGELPLAREHHEIALSLGNHKRPLAATVIDEEVCDLSCMAWIQWHLGYPDQALKSCHEAVETAQALSHPHSIAFAYGYAIHVHRLRRQVEALREINEREFALSSEYGIADFLALAIGFRGWGLAMQGHEEGIALIEECVASSRVTGLKVFRPHQLCMLAEACGEVGRFDRGLEALTEALTIADEDEDRYCEAETYRLKGELLLKQSDSNVGEAGNCFRRAIEIARKQSAKSWELRATMSLARLLVQQGRCAEARTMLAEIYNWFTEGFDTADLKDAKALLDELAA
jgi:class 3 adenylate cyclase/predicted ATPase